VFQFLDKKRAEGKPYYVYMTAGSNKFLRIYYGRVKEFMGTLDMPVDTDSTGLSRRLLTSGQRFGGGLFVLLIFLCLFFLICYWLFICRLCISLPFILRAGTLSTLRRICHSSSPFSGKSRQLVLRTVSLNRNTS